MCHLRKLANRFINGQPSEQQIKGLAERCRVCQFLPTGQEKPTDENFRQSL
ncbi:MULTISPECIES: hypothetical protein [Rhizobium]|uniref:hypothetical protein n=1 Tax=Rhizobium TaxID=379 RepID=UPI000A869998|nr:MULTISPECIES: hypothetical protein [Rhizobium]